MRRRQYIIMACLFLIVLGILVFYPKKSTPVITYFPLDEESQFQQATNTLRLSQAEQSDSYSITWDNHSASDDILYLRQDVSVLYKDGHLIGVKSIWEENGKTIDFSETFNFKNDHFFQAITLHYGEKHYPGDIINSLQKMSYSELFVTGQQKNGIPFFEEPKTNHDSHAQTELQQKTKENLQHHWHKLKSYFNIDLAQYEVVPLTELHQFETKGLLSFTQEQTDEIIAKLWEGLYKNYIVPITSEKEKDSDSYIPLILFGKHEHDILVLFELNGEKIKLKQIYPTFQ